MKRTLLLLAAAFVLFSCGNELEDFQPEVTTMDISKTTPAALQTNSPAVYAELTTMQAYMNMGAMYMQFEDQNKAGYNQTYNYNGYSIDYVVDQVGSQYVYTYTVSLNGVAYYWINGWEESNGTAGHWDYTFNENVYGSASASTFTIDFDWTKDSNNNYHMEMLFDMGVNSQLKYIMELNSDLSGSIMYYLNNDIWFESIWDSNGNGYYIDYFFDPNTNVTF